MQIMTAKEKISRTHAKLDWLLRRNEKILREAIREWFSLTFKQIRDDLTRKFIKATASEITAELTHWETIKGNGVRTIKPAVLTVIGNGGQKAYELLRISGTFDVLNVRAIKIAEGLCAKLVKDVTKGTKAGIRTYISTGVKEGESMDKVARGLRPLVGLTQGQTEAVMNYRNSLKEQGLSEAEVDRKVTKYADKTHRRRAETIARTETARAQNTGYVEGLKELGVNKVEFSAYPGCCDICDLMDGKEYPIGRADDVIPVHPNCRCALLPVVE